MYQHSTSILYKKEPTHVSFAIHPTPKGVGFLALRFCKWDWIFKYYCKYNLNCYNSCGFIKRRIFSM